MTALVLGILATHSFAHAPTLADLARMVHLNLGTCAQSQFLQDDIDGGQYKKALLENFTMLEPENDLKPPAIWLGPNHYDFSKSDYLVGAPGQKGWAATNHIKVRGHVLVYARDDGYTIPRWLLSEEAKITPDQAKAMLRDYIFAVAGRYKGKVAMWDVVNEAIEDKENDRPLGLRDSFWFRKLGPEFLVDAFQFALEADPKAELYYNEYGVENYSPKAKHLLELVDFLKAHKAPITGVGLQYHTWPEDVVAPGDAHYRLIEELQKRKLAFMITELDLEISVVPKPRNDPEFGLDVKDPAELTLQADRYKSILEMALSFPNCHGVQFWGFTDRHSWIPQFNPSKGAALILDGDYKPKPAYDAVYKLLKDRANR